MSWEMGPIPFDTDWGVLLHGEIIPALNEQVAFEAAVSPGYVVHRVDGEWLLWNGLPARTVGDHHGAVAVRPEPVDVTLGELERLLEDCRWYDAQDGRELGVPAGRNAHDASV